MYVLGLIPSGMSLVLGELSYTWFYSTVFPLYILMSIAAQPSLASHRLSIMYPVKISNSLFIETVNMFNGFYYK